jgi:hypothetical protein
MKNTCLKLIVLVAAFGLLGLIGCENGLTGTSDLNDQNDTNNQNDPKETGDEGLSIIGTWRSLPKNIDFEYDYYYEIKFIDSENLTFKYYAGETGYGTYEYIQDEIQKYPLLETGIIHFSTTHIYEGETYNFNWSSESIYYKLKKEWVIWRIDSQKNSILNGNYYKQ